MSLPYPTGLPGLTSTQVATPRIIFRQGNWLSDLAGGKIINGALSRDTGNTGDLDVLRPGLLMGKITATGKYAPSILGVTTGAYTSGGTSVTVSAAQAVEIVRRVGATGNLKWVGPPTAAGTNAVSAAIAYSAINTTTGVITTADVGADLVAGSFAIAEDGSGVPITLIGDDIPWGLKVTDAGGSSQDTPFPHFPIAGVLISENLLPAWPSDTSLQAWIVASMNTYGKFVFDHGYNV